MPDNVAITAGSGTTISTEEVTTLNGGAVSAQHIQRVIPSVRTADGTALDVTAANPMPISDGGGSVTVDGTLTLSGENHIGEVGGNSAVIRPTITVTAGAYSANDVVGARQTLTNAMRVSSGTGVLQDILITTADGEALAGNILLFNSTTASSIADNAAFAWGAGDHAKLLGIVTVSASDYVTMDSDGICHKQGLGIVVAASGSQSLYAYFVTTGTPTFAATTDLQIAYKFLRD
jgi:hypothetical protein